MAEFTLLTQIQQPAPGVFRAQVMAIPRGVQERCAPEERVAFSVCRAEAVGDAARLARALAADIRARGNRVAVPGGSRGVKRRQAA